MDAGMLRGAFRSGGSSYDFETGICCIDATSLEGRFIDTGTEVEFVHETTHWLTEALTSIGQLLAFVKSSRGPDLVEAARFDPELRKFIHRQTKTEEGLLRRPVVPNWNDFDNWPNVHEKYDVFFEKLLLDVRLETILCHRQRVENHPTSELAVMAHALGRYSEWMLHNELIADNTYTQQMLEKFVDNSSKSKWFQTKPIYRGHYYTTTDLIEAIAVCSEFVWAMRYGVASTYGPSRLNRIRNSRYIAPIREILFGLGRLVSTQEISKNIVQILIILCASLNPPIPPLETPNYDHFAWEHIYPPLRFLRFFQNSAVVKYSGNARNFDPPNFNYEAELFQSYVYQLMDPPDRNFAIRIPEKVDHSAFAKLPHEHQIDQESGIWKGETAPLTPYDLRLYAASQLRIALHSAGLETLEATILYGDLKPVSRFSVPILTIRRPKNISDETTVPINSQLIDNPEALSWYLHFTGIQTAALDIVFRSGPVKYGEYLRVFNDLDPNWVKEIERRSRTTWDRVFAS